MPLYNLLTNTEGGELSRHLRQRGKADLSLAVALRYNGMVLVVRYTKEDLHGDKRFWL
jgi:hypothetical protein